MAQAESISTAIRQLMSRGGRTKCTSPVRLALVEFIAALAGIVPHPIHADIDSEDLDGRADHLEKLFAALHVYLTAIIADTAQNIPSGTSIAATSTRSLAICQLTSFASSAMLRTKCVSMRIGGRHDPRVRGKANLSQQL
jgi:hypothetical protein